MPLGTSESISIAGSKFTPPSTASAVAPASLRAQVVRGVDQRDVRERLRKVARPAGALAGRTPPRAGRRRCAAPAAARTARRASSMRPEQHVGVGQPEAAGEERAFARRQPVVGRAACRSAARSRPRAGRRSIASTVPRMRGSSAAESRSAAAAAGSRRAAREPYDCTKLPSSRVEAAARRRRRGCRRAARASARPARRGRTPRRS